MMQSNENLQMSEVKDEFDSDLVIHYARYGSDEHKRNVINFFNGMISSHCRLNFLVDSDNLGGDYYPGKPKQLHMIYTFNGKLYEEKLDEGEVLVIPKSHIEVADTVPNSVLLGMLLNNVGTGLVVLAFTFGISLIVKELKRQYA